MALTQKEISSREQELDILFRSRKNEITELERVIKSATSRKYKIDEDIRDSQEEFEDLRDKTKMAQATLHRVNVEAKNLKSEAVGILSDAKSKNEDAAQLVSEKAKDLASLDRGKSIVVQAKKQIIENTKIKEELNRKCQETLEKREELEKLIIKQGDVDSVKEEVKKSQEELKEIIEENKSATKILSESVADKERERDSLKIEIRRYSNLTKETEEATELLDVKTKIKEKEIEEVETIKIGNSEKYAQTVAKLEAKNRIVDAKEKKLDFILAKLKKNKKLTDDLKDIGL